ncbi:FAD-binding monooxygenase [Streptomyces sp. L2]|uniref:NAD(P)/FAD-dependent oxidoreductase n=1 Tax=Streptomyces sp. L2 TaxID=2162665 RepID=UPI0010108752|nr:FAD-binding monooxygenase [Streptomyces sp. L2]
MSDGHGHAVVCGAGMAGLFAAAALAPHYRHVTLIERDRLAALDFRPRKGIPQGHHVHGLLLRGAEAFEELLPGLRDELVGAGAELVRVPEDFWIEFMGHSLSTPVTDYRGIMASRPFLESHVRRRVLALPGVALRDGHEAGSLLYNAGNTRVAGVRLTRAGSDQRSESMEADLVVDAQGRSARGLVWREDLGFQRPREARIAVGVRYTSQHFHLPPSTATTAVKLFNVAFPSGSRRRGAFLARQEHDQWVLSLTHYDDDVKAPADLRSQARDLLPGPAYELLAAGEPLDAPAGFRFPGGHRRFYERLRRHPAGLISTGDAICCLNPLYGTGMTIAAELALRLRSSLADGPPTTLPARFYRQAARVARSSWLTSSLFDRVLNPPRARAPFTAMAAGYAQRLAAAAAHDPALALAIVECLSRVSSPLALARPDAILRTLCRSNPRL